eukprot:972873_1
MADGMPSHVISVGDKAAELMALKRLSEDGSMKGIPCHWIKTCEKPSIDKLCENMEFIERLFADGDVLRNIDVDTVNTDSEWKSENLPIDSRTTADQSLKALVLKKGTIVEYEGEKWRIKRMVYRNQTHKRPPVFEGFIVVESISVRMRDEGVLVESVHVGDVKFDSIHLAMAQFEVEKLSCCDICSRQSKDLNVLAKHKRLLHAPLSI